MAPGASNAGRLGCRWAVVSPHRTRVSGLPSKDLRLFRHIRKRLANAAHDATPGLVDGLERRAQFGGYVGRFLSVFFGSSAGLGYPGPLEKLILTKVFVLPVFVARQDRATAELASVEPCSRPDKIPYFSALLVTTRLARVERCSPPSKLGADGFKF
jgi:hypothetical protein